MRRIAPWYRLGSTLEARSPLETRPQAKSESVADRLQQGFGNAAANRWLQARVAPANGPHEKEADRAAEAVTRDAEPVERAAASPAPEGRLDAGSLRFFERRLGQGLGDVKIRADGAAAAEADLLGARAFTRGREIAFGRGEYRPHEPEGRKLLAHELAHVVQQRGGNQRGTLASGFGSGLSAAPAGTVQRKLVAKGKTAGFATLVDTLMTPICKIEISQAGEVSLKFTGVSGPMTAAGQALHDTLRMMIQDGKTTTVTFIRGDAATDAVDKQVFIGSYNAEKIDLDDIEKFGSGDQKGITSASTLNHELVEQYRKQVHGEDYATAHAAGQASEKAAAGGTRGATSVKHLGGGKTQYSIPYAYPDGSEVTVIFVKKGGKVLSVKRKTTKKATK